MGGIHHGEGGRGTHRCFRDLTVLPGLTCLLWQLLIREGAFGEERIAPVRCPATEIGVASSVRLRRGLSSWRRNKIAESMKKLHNWEANAHGKLDNLLSISIIDKLASVRAYQCRQSHMQKLQMAGAMRLRWARAREGRHRKTQEVTRQKLKEILRGTLYSRPPMLAHVLAWPVSLSSTLSSNRQLGALICTYDQLRIGELFGSPCSVRHNRPTRS